MPNLGAAPLFVRVPIMTVMLVLVGAALGGPATASPHSAHADGAGPFAGQARQLGLTEAEADRLQAQVAREVRRTGGTQVALNKVHFPGGNTVLVLPGETYARDLTRSTVAARGTRHDCPYYNFCTYMGENYTGGRHELYHCTYYPVTYWMQSYVNNQTEDRVARFYDDDGDFFLNSEPAYHEEISTGIWGKLVKSIKPC